MGRLLVGSICCVFLAVVLRDVTGYPSGAADTPATCSDMRPRHSTYKPQSLPPPFDIEVNQNTYYSRDQIRVTIKGHKGFTFKGFFIQARRVDERVDRTELIGTFNAIPGTKVICNGQTGNALTHNDEEEGSETPKNEITLTWRAPDPQKGHIQFLVTVVSALTDFWVAERSVVIEDPLAPELQVPSTPKPAVPVPVPATMDLSRCGDDRGCYREPHGCKEEAECTSVVTWKADGEFVDFELAGDAKGWIALGFSKDTLMGDDSVVECVWNEEKSTVEVRLSFNTEDTKKNEVLEGFDSALTGAGGYYTNDRIKCVFRRRKQMGKSPKVFDLNEDYHLLIGHGAVNEDGEKMIHSLEPMKFPMVSPSKVKFANTKNLSGRARYPLVKAHACLMLIAWMMCASLAVIMARYYKPMWPNDKLCRHSIWFAVHRGCMLVALFATVIGVILIIIHVGGYSEYPVYPGKAHPPLGITVTILVILNPLIAACRPNPKAGRRPIFNWIHWLFGTAAHVLSTPTMFIGLSLYKVFVPWWATWVMVAFMLFHIIIELLLEIHGCINARKQKQRSLEWELSRKADPREFDGLQPDPVGTRFKTIIISIYLFVMIILGIVMVITIAVS